MSTPRPLVRGLLALVLGAVGAVALVGGLYLRGSGLIGIAVSGGLVACLVAGIARETPPGVRRTRPLDAAVQVGGSTVLVMLVVCGTAVLAGGGAAAALSLVTVGGAVVAAVRYGKRSTAPRPATPAASVPDLQGTDAGGPVPGLTTQALGREWLRTTAMLGAALLPEDRAALVRRRQEALDELERRDAEGFGRWLSVGGPETDPAEYVRGERTAGTDAA